MSKIYAKLSVVLAVILMTSCEDSKKFVDLGLTSGTLWATCNVGGVNPWDYGDYYAWGAISAADCYDWYGYDLCEGEQNRLTKYCTIADYGNNGMTDSICILESANDAATANWGRKWQMPTIEQWHELAEECYWVWTTNYMDAPVSGFIVYKAKNDSYKGVFAKTTDAAFSFSDTHIFLPASGYHYGENFYYDEICGNYWSSSLCKDYPCTAGNFVFDSAGLVPDSEYGSRCDGLSVRAVRK